MFSVPDGGAHRADQSHDQQDAKQNQDLHVGHPLHVGALQRRLGGVLERRSRMQHVGKQRTQDELTREQEIIALVDSVLSFTCINLESWPV